MSLFSDNISFKLTPLEVKKAKEFYAKHDKCIHGVGMKFSYIISPTGVGDVIEIRCNGCKETENITDVDSW